MKPPQPLAARNFPSAGEDAGRAAPQPGRYDGPESAYHLAFTDLDFLLQEELRPVRVQLELLKPEMVQARHHIVSTIVIFGSARILPPEEAQAALAALRLAQPLQSPQATQSTEGTQSGQGSQDAQALARAQTAVEMSRYYGEARRFAALVTEGTRHLPTPIHVVTGGGPGIMEAGNRGALETGGKSIGLNIVLPHEQMPNDYITPELCFQFHYFALRKMHFLMRATALACFPGGFGTLDELFEVLTLMQTGKSRMRPILLFGRKFWSRLIDFDLLIETGMIAPSDVSLFRFVETADEGWDALKSAYGL